MAGIQASIQKRAVFGMARAYSWLPSLFAQNFQNPGDSGIRQALKAIFDKSLYLNNNQISTEEWKNIKLPYSIERVHISGNPITDLETNKKYPYLEAIFEE